MMAEKTISFTEDDLLEVFPATAKLWPDAAAKRSNCSAILAR